MNGEHWLKIGILLTEHIGVGDSLIINTLQNGMITKWHEFSDSVDVNYLTQVCYFKKDCVKIASVQKTRSTVCFIACVIGNV